MEVRAVGKYIRVQPRKVRIIADLVRGKNANYSAAQLRFHSSKSAKALHKVLLSAMANAQENHGLDPDSLRIAVVKVDEGPRLKRIQARAQGRANRILKKMSHITVVVDDQGAIETVRPHGTKAKPRPSFGKPAPKKGATKKATAKAAAPTEVEEPITEAPAAVEAEVVETTPAPSEGAADVVEEATPVTPSDAPEEAGSAGPVATQTSEEEKA